MGNVVGEMLRALRLVSAVVPCDVMLKKEYRGIQGRLNTSVRFVGFV